MFKLRNHLNASGVLCESGSCTAETALRCETKGLRYDFDDMESSDLVLTCVCLTQGQLESFRVLQEEQRMTMNNAQSST